MSPGEEKWLEAMKAKGHMPRTIRLDGDLVIDVMYSGDYHEGPYCVACDWCCCWHCDGIETIPDCEAIQPSGVQ